LLTVLGIAGGLVALLVFAVKGVASNFDPERAKHSVLVERDGSFVLEVPSTRRDPLYFRLELDEPSTDDDYDVLVTAEVVDEAGGTTKLAWKTKDRSRLEGAKEARSVGNFLGVTMSTATFELALALPAGRVTVRGEVACGEGTVLRRSWVFLPA